ncbi:MULTISPECIES: ribosomal protein S18-alanine N-acetyltransferase [Sulfurisphaera]|uniref:N-alpha-acetyltransferase n=3 Tax=Sulfurisphaera TaxID=69655 RepID=NAT_SULTO|nr:MULTISPECIES: ribosomal protein S18-alanine N-acetyltransferase [Sulfurisphaera]Q976C3.1 RecName: Full=N-alpha-acetyltransferase; Short=NAT; AltName: Full=Amino-terminal acetyltransferase; AltName: Full=N-terminal acetyltransferase [Sulfurisphaera tokodaii str. 7]MBB5253205.1 ribosomal-protein-alanine N-acetyltransferase [Sulfurisphaera ohwakuensis]QGR15885.1 ribosomal-protein-alanine N-acetyltransferase [Sulfurisphaera ohwakuensis]BAB65224.1 acetyltransferase [Sulfurisphaera tokodaii str. 7
MEFAEAKKGKEYRIRNARLTDVDQIIKINRLALPENYPYYFFVEHLKEYEAAFFVAEVDGEVVGYIMPRIEWGFSNLKQLPTLVKKGHVVSIAVLEQYRRLGIGTALLQASMKAMKEVYNAEEVYLEVRVSNSPAINLYKKLGFKEVKVLRHYYADGEDAYLMAAPL